MSTIFDYTIEFEITPDFSKGVYGKMLFWMVPRSKSAPELGVGYEVMVPEFTVEVLRKFVASDATRQRGETVLPWTVGLYYRNYMIGGDEDVRAALAHVEGLPAKPQAPLPQK